MKEEIRKSLTEVLEIISCLDKKYVEKIPDEFYNFLEENKSETYKTDLDYSKPIYEMDLREYTKDILAMMYFHYWSNKPDNENELNELIIREELIKDYINDIFDEKMFKTIKGASKVNKIKQILIDDIINDLLIYIKKYLYT